MHAWIDINSIHPQKYGAQLEFQGESKGKGIGHPSFKWRSVLSETLHLLSFRTDYTGVYITPFLSSLPSHV